MSRNFQVGVQMFLRQEMSKVERVKQLLLNVCRMIGYPRNVNDEFISNSCMIISQEDSTIIYLQNLVNSLSRFRSKEEAYKYLFDNCKQCGPRTCGGSNQSMTKLKSTLKVILRK